jgi:hypothetical protein
LVVFVLQDASPHFKSNQEFFAFSRTQRQKALWNHQPSWWFSYNKKSLAKARLFLKAFSGLWLEHNRD